MLRTPSDTEREDLGPALLQIRTFDNGGLVFLEGEKGHELYVVEEGEAEAFRPAQILENNAYEAGSGETVLETYRLGDHFGGVS